MGANTLDRFRSVELAYRRTRDALKVAQRLLHADPRARLQTHLADVADHQLDAEFSAMQDRLAEATVINAWVVFERFVIGHVTSSCVVKHDAPDRFSSLLGEKVADEIERWRFDELLGLYKGLIESDALGYAKQVKAYRDWVAHRNPRRLPHAAIEPDDALRTLSSIVLRVEAGEPGGSEPGS